MKNILYIILSISTITFMINVVNSLYIDIQTLKRRKKDSSKVKKEQEIPPKERENKISQKENNKFHKNKEK